MSSCLLGSPFARRLKTGNVEVQVRPTATAAFLADQPDPLAGAHGGAAESEFDEPPVEADEPVEAQATAERDGDPELVVRERNERTPVLVHLGDPEHEDIGREAAESVCFEV